MSLLMDALKKAEQEKKKALEDTGAHRREEVDRPVAELRPEDAPGKTFAEKTLNKEIAGDTTSGELTLEPLPPVEEHRAESLQEAIVTDKTLDISDELKTELGDMTLELPRDPTLGTEPGASYDREATLPSERAIKASLRDYFDGSQSLSSQSLSSQSISLERSGERTRPGASTTPLRPEPLPSGSYTTRVSAHTIFTAGRKAPKWKIGYAVAALILLTVPFLFYVIYNEMRTSPKPDVFLAEKPVVGTPPEKAVVTPTPAPSAPVTPPATTVQTVPPTPEPGGMEPPAAETREEAIALAEPSKTMPTPGSDITAPGAKEPSAAPESPKEIAALKPEKEAALSEGKAKAPAARTKRRSTTRARVFDDYAGEVPVASAAPPPMRLDTSDLQISKSRGQGTIHPRVSEAYQAFQAGQYGRDRMLYESVLAQHPENRDALLGLGAIAMQTGSRERSYQYYRRALELNPQDSVAAAALAHLQRNAGGQARESQLKLLLDKDQKSPQIHFGLGNVYARQSRWAEAQEAYFQAYARDEQNANYAFNLAVSLDHLGQNKAALSYYRQALSLADRQPDINFNTAQVLARIEKITALGGAD